MRRRLRSGPRPSWRPTLGVELLEDRTLLSGSPVLAGRGAVSPPDPPPTSPEPAVQQSPTTDERPTTTGSVKEETPSNPLIPSTTSPTATARPTTTGASNLSNSGTVASDN